MSLTKVSYSMINGAVANVLDFGAVGDGVTNDAAAIQAAIDAVCPLFGVGDRAGIVYFPYTKNGYRITTSLNCTNSRTAGTLIRDGLKLQNVNLIGATGAGNCVVETTGSQWLEMDGQIVATTSTVGILQAVSTVLPQTQNQKLHVRIFMTDIANANGNMGTVGIWNFGAEENTYDCCYIQANIPVFMTSYKVSPNVTGTIPPSYQVLEATHSTGVNTWSGETFLASLNRRSPALITEDVNSLHFENVYLSNIGSGGGCLDAWRIFGGFQGGEINGTIEQFTSIRVIGKVIGAKIRFTFGGLVTSGQERIVLNRGGQGQIVDSDISFQDTSDPNRALMSATPISANEQISCYLQNVKIRCNADKQYLKIPENTLWNPSTGNVDIEGIHGANLPYRYTVDASRTQKVAIPPTVCFVFGVTSSAEVVRFIMPTITGSLNSLGASIRVTGLATIVGSSTNAMSARFIDALIMLAVGPTGTIFISSVTNIAGAQQDVNSGGNSITALAMSGVNQTTYVQIVIAPTETGANNESITFSGAAELRWSGNESRAPSLQTLS